MSDRYREKPQKLSGSSDFTISVPVGFFAQGSRMKTGTDASLLVTS